MAFKGTTGIGKKYNWNYFMNNRSYFQSVKLVIVFSSGPDQTRDDPRKNIC